MGYRYKLLFSFLLCYLYMVFLPSLTPYVKVLYFCPFVVLLFVGTTFSTSLWFSALAALFVDLHASSTPLGFTCLNYILTTLLVYRFRVYFLEEKIHVFSLYATLFSLCSTFIHFFLYALIDMRLKIHFFTFLTDLLVMPIVDGIYFLLCFLYPLAVIDYLLQPKTLYVLNKWKKQLVWKTQITLRKLRLPL